MGERLYWRNTLLGVNVQFPNFATRNELGSYKIGRWKLETYVINFWIHLQSWREKVSVLEQKTLFSGNTKIHLRIEAFYRKSVLLLLTVLYYIKHVDISIYQTTKNQEIYCTRIRYDIYTFLLIIVSIQPPTYGLLIVNWSINYKNTFLLSLLRLSHIPKTIFMLNPCDKFFKGDVFLI